MALGGLSTKPLFEPWEQEGFAQVLSGFTGIPLEMLFHPQDKVVSVLIWPGGELRNLTFDEFPWPPGTRA
jgi:hypothetical protein